MDGFILVATDGHTDSDAALMYAETIADRLDQELHVVYVVDERLLEVVGFADAREELEAHLESTGSSALERARSSLETDAVSTELRTGRPHEEILRAGSDASMIVIGRRHGGERPPGRLGSTAARVIPQSTVPVLSVPVDAPAPPAGPFASALIPTDGSDYPDRAASVACPLIDTEAGDIHGLYVIDADIYELSDAPRSVIGILREGGQAALADLARVASEHDVSFARHIRRGAVVETIHGAIDDLEPTLVAMGTRGRSAGSGPLLGSTTAGVLRDTTIPVLTAP